MFDFLNNINFVNPELLVLLLLIPIIGVWFFLKKKEQHVSLKMPTLEAIAMVATFRGTLRKYLPVLRALAFAALVIALARPQLTLQEEEIKAEGIDIFLVMDLSSSMLAQDFKPDRLEVSKRVAADFVEKRLYDRIGLAVFPEKPLPSALSQLTTRF